MEAARLNVMRFIDIGLPFAIKIRAVFWVVRDDEDDYYDVPEHFKAETLMNGRFHSWEAYLRPL